MSNYTSTFTLFRDDKAPVKFSYSRRGDAMDGLTISRTNEDATEDMYLIAMLTDDAFDRLSAWSFNDDATGAFTADDIARDGGVLEITQPNRTDYDLKFVRVSKKGTRKCALLLDHHQVGRVQGWLTRVLPTN